MAPHAVYLINKFSAIEQTQDYAFFSEAPKIARSGATSVTFSNVFQSTTLAREESWSLGLTDNYYACT